MTIENEKLRKLVEETGLPDAEVARRIRFNGCQDRCRERLYQYISGRRKPSAVNKDKIAEGLSEILKRKIYTNEF